MHPFRRRDASPRGRDTYPVVLGVTSGASILIALLASGASGPVSMLDGCLSCLFLFHTGY